MEPTSYLKDATGGYYSPSTAAGNYNGYTAVTDPKTIAGLSSGSITSTPGNIRPQTPTDTQTTSTTPPPTTPSSDQTNLTTAQQEKGVVDTEYQNTAQQVHDTILGIQNGSVPLSAGEQAQIQGLQQQFGALIEQQKLVNKGAEGTANIRGYQSGAAEYDPTFQAKTIGSIITGGLNKIAELNTKMAAGVANLTQSLKNNDISAVKEAYSVYQEAAKNRQEALQKTIDQAQTVIKKAQEDKRISEIDTHISDLFDQGIKTPSAILQRLRDLGVAATAEQVDKTLKIINPTQDLAGLAADYRTFLALQKSGDPSVKGLNWMQYQRAVTNATSKLTSSGGSGGGSISSVTKSIIENPSLFDDLTPTVRGQVIAELQAAGYSTTNLGVKSLSDGAIGKIADTQSAISNLTVLKQKISENLEYIGPIQGFQALNPYSKARQVQAEIDKVKQTVGKALEGGVLRKEDEEKYKKILATINDTPETAVYKIDSLISSIQRDIETYKSLQQSAGRSVDVNQALTKPGDTTPPDQLRTKYGY